MGGSGGNVKVGYEEEGSKWEERVGYGSGGGGRVR